MLNQKGGKVPLWPSWIAEQLLCCFRLFIRNSHISNFSTLSFWLTEAGINRSTITMFSWAALAYSFKFIWAPLIDKLPLPYLTRKMGLRRSWLLVAQILVICAICLMAFTNPYRILLILAHFQI